MKNCRRDYWLIATLAIGLLLAAGCGGVGGIGDGISGGSPNLHVFIDGQGYVVEETARPFSKGDQITLQAVPNEGWEWVGWEGGVLAELGENRYQIVLHKETTLTAMFTSDYPYHFVKYGPNLPWSLYQIAIDGQGRVYGTLSEEHKVIVIDGDTYATWGTYGSAAGEFQYPTTIAVDDDGYIYVSEYMSLRIQKYTSDGQFQREFRPGIEFGDRESWEVDGLAVDSNGNIYVAEYNVFDNRSRVQVLNPEGKLIREWLEPGNEPGKAFRVDDVTIDNLGQVYLTSGHRLLVFDKDDKFLWEIGGRGDGAGKFENPRGVAVNSEGRIAVVDSGNHRLQFFTSEGAFLSSWGTGYGGVQGPSRMWYPSYAVFNGNDDLFVTEMGRLKLLREGHR